MVGMRILLIFILSFLLFNTPVYALRPSDIEESTVSEEETIPSEIKEEIEKIKMEKRNIMKDIAPLREERRKTLHPFVYEEFPSDIETRPARHAVKGFILATPGGEVTRARPSGQGLASKPLPNLIFFSVIIIGFLAAYFFIRPKSK